MNFSVKFKSYEDRQKAKDKLYNECGGSSIYGGESTYGDYYYLNIYDTCTDFSKARQICKMYGGEIE
ncbi:MAG: hypothetical protein LBL13_09885 [Bacteroidales bacterium]|jgi:hypothetical protein|nr:hypothetical protein [Bacteroidales bacterium]